MWTQVEWLRRQLTNETNRILSWVQGERYYNYDTVGTHTISIPGGVEQILITAIASGGGGGAGGTVGNGGRGGNFTLLGTTGQGSGNPTPDLVNLLMTWRSNHGARGEVFGRGGLGGTSGQFVENAWIPLNPPFNGGVYTITIGVAGLGGTAANAAGGNGTNGGNLTITGPNGFNFTLLGGRGGVGGINTETTTARAGQQGTDRSIHASWAVSGSDNQGQQGIGDRQNRVSTTTITHPNFPANNSAAAAFVRHNIGTQPAINGSLSNREAVFNGGSEAAGLRGRGGGGAGGGFRTIGGAGAVLSSRTPHTSPQNAFGQTGSSTRSNGSNGTVGFIEIQF